jgi:hypothetical protein
VSDIFEEAGNELKQERIVGFVTKYAPHFICLLISIIIFTSIGVVWKNHVASKQRHLGDIYNKMLFLANNKDDVKATNEALDHLISSDDKGYQALAILKKCQLLIEAKQYDKAIELYDKIHHNKSLDKALRDLASLLATSLIIEQKQDNTIDKRLAYLVDKDNIFRASGMLLKISYLLQNNKKLEAMETAEKIVDDETIISTIRSKAQAILAVN